MPSQAAFLNPHLALGLSRREMLQRMGTGVSALGLAAVLGQETRAVEASPASPLAPKPAHFAPKARHLIQLFMGGGPSHVDTFDPKPGLDRLHGQKVPDSFKKPDQRNGNSTLMKSPFKFAKAGKSGIEVSEIFPQVAGCIDDICVIRSMHTNIPNHEPALLMMCCGDVQPVRPSMGSWLLYGLGTENQNLPGFVVLCPGKPVVGPALWSNSFLPGIFQGTHINNGRMDPKSAIPNVNNPYLGRAAQREQMDLLKQLNEAHLAGRSGDNPLEARIASLEMAFRMQFEAQDAFDLGKETNQTRELYGKGQFADGCLAARRLIERGVRVVQVFYGSGQPWDDHGDIMGHATKAKDSDQAIAALLKDLKGRGLLDETIVLWGGEFGRTPTSQGKGRDHHSTGFSVWMAGGGVKGGMTHGATDEIGFHAVENPVHVHDLHATILHLMGMNHEKLTYRYGGRDFRLTDVYGNVVRDILA
jgi:hypothetical protein